MSGAITAVAVGTVGSAIIGNQQAKAAEGAANAQKKAIGEASDVERERLAMEQQQYQEQMAEYQRKQAMYEKQQAQTVKNLAPYMQAGQGALFEMMALTGMAAPQGAKMPTYEGGGALSRMPFAAAGTETGQGRMGILSPGKSGGIAGGISPAAAEFDRGGYGLRSSIFDRIPLLGTTADPRAQAASMLAQVTKEMPNATDAEQRAEAIARLNARYNQEQTAETLGQARAEVPTIEAATSPYAGMTGDEAQQSAIQRISESPLLQELMAQGETGILQNQAATGGLRGGRTQAALAQFRPAMLQQEIDKQYARLQGISGLGQQSILGSPTTAVGAMPAGGYDTSTLSGLLSQSGAAQAGGILSQSAIQGNTLANIGQIAGWGLEKYEQGGFFPTGGSSFPTGGSSVNYGSLGIGNPSNY